MAPGPERATTPGQGSTPGVVGLRRWVAVAEEVTDPPKQAEYHIAAAGNKATAPAVVATDARCGLPIDHRSPQQPDQLDTRPE